MSIAPPSNVISLYLYGINIIKYTSSGKTQWIADISGASTNFGNLGTDGTNIYGSGTYYFNPETNINDCLPIIINADKTITIISNIVPVEGESGSFIVKYNTLGIAQWTNNLNNLFLSNIVNWGLKCYTTGLAGPTYGKDGVSPTIYNLNGTVFKSYPYINTGYVIEYDIDGNPVWCSKINYEGIGGCFLIKTTVSSSGVYVVGSFGNFSRDDLFVPSVIRFCNANDVETAISVSTGSYSCMFIAKYNTSGTPLWATKVQYGPNGNFGWTRGASIVIDSNEPNSIYAIGEYKVNDQFDPILLPINVYSANDQVTPTKQVYGWNIFTSIIIIKYNQAGVVQWAANIRGPGGGQYMSPQDLTVSAGLIYIVGSAYYSDVATYDPTNATTDPSTGTQTPTGNTMVWSGTDTTADGILVTYNTDGIPQWKTRIIGTSNGLASVTIGGGNIYVGGIFNNNPNPPIITFYNTPDGTDNSKFVLTNSATTNNFTVAYNLQGKVQWVQNTCAPGINALVGDSLTYTTALFVAAPGTGVAQSAFSAVQV